MNKNTESISVKHRATVLLRKYDEMRKELRNVEKELAKACAIYGREIGYSGFTKDQLRIQLDLQDNSADASGPQRSAPL